MTSIAGAIVSKDVRMRRRDAALDLPVYEPKQLVALSIL